jgi:hypothetical protein
MVSCGARSKVQACSAIEPQILHRGILFGYAELYVRLVSLSRNMAVLTRSNRGRTAPLSAHLAMPRADSACYSAMQNQILFRIAF